MIYSFRVFQTNRYDNNTFCCKVYQFSLDFGSFLTEHSKAEEPSAGETVDRTETLLKYCVKTPLQEVSASGDRGDSNPSTMHGQWDYAWMTQHFSVDRYPEVWQHPLYLALEATQHKKSVTFEEIGEPSASVILDKGEEDGGTRSSIESINEENNCDNDNDLVALAFKKLEMNEELECISQISSIKSTEDGNQSVVASLKQFGDKGLTSCVFSPVPKSLPLNCVASHLHKWGTKEFWDTEGKLAEAAFLNGRIKVVCSKGVVYR